MEEQAAKTGQTGEEISAFLGGIKEAPVQSIAQGVGSAVPAMLAGAVTLVAGAPAALVGAVTIGTRFLFGALQGAGEVKGSIYDNVYDELRKNNVPEEEAKKQAEEAQDYIGKNSDNIFVGAGLGALAGGTGAERVVGNYVAKKLGVDIAKGAAKEEAEGLIMRGVKEAFKEAIPEGLQGGQEQFATNIALSREGYETPEFEGVLGSAARDAVIGALTGAAISPFARPEKEAKPSIQEPLVQQKLPEDQLIALRDQYQEAEKQLDDLAKATKIPGLSPEDRGNAVDAFLQFRNTTFMPLRLEYMRNIQDIRALGAGVATLPPTAPEIPPVAPVTTEVPPPAPPLATLPPIEPVPGTLPKEPTVDQPTPEPPRDTTTPPPDQGVPPTGKPAGPVEPPQDITPPERRDFQSDKPLEQIAKEIHGLTVPELAKWAVENAPNTPAKEFATKAFDRINEYADRGIFPGTVSVRNGNQRNESGKRAATKFFYARGDLGRGVDTGIYFNGLDNQGQADRYSGTRYSTVLHELLHAATHVQIEFNPNSASVKELNNLYDLVRTRTMQDIRNGKQHPAFLPIARGANTLKNVHELVSWGLTDQIGRAHV